MKIKVLDGLFVVGRANKKNVFAKRGDVISVDKFSLSRLKEGLHYQTVAEKPAAEKTPPAVT